MTITVKTLVPSKLMENVQTTQYTATSAKALIDKATVTNVTAANVTFSVNLVTSGGAAGSSNLFIYSRIVTPNETYTCPELIGQVIQNGDFISTIVDTASALTLRISGREIT